jgi:hypothetical protein
VADFETVDTWEDIELYEKTRVREIRKRIILFGAALLFVFGVTAYPIAEKRMPYWRILFALSGVNNTLEAGKVIAFQKKQAFRLEVFQKDEEWWVRYGVVRDCQDSAESPVEKKLGLSVAEFSALEHEGVTQMLCFDSRLKMEADAPAGAIAFVPTEDLESKALDRASFLVFQPSTGALNLK